MQSHAQTATATTSTDRTALAVLAGIAAYPVALASVMALTVACMQLFT